MGDLPTPRDDADRKVLADIKRFGWHCVLVDDAAHPEHAEANASLPPDAVYDATFAYTVGLTYSYRHPELILVGRWNQAQAIITVAADLVTREGHALTPGELRAEVLEGYDVRFDEVAEADRLRYLTWADWANRGARFDALQIVLPDGSGRWPDDPGYDAWAQPLLS